MHRLYGDRVEFVAVYLREAHPCDGWRVAANDKIGLIVPQPTGIKERRDVAQKCCTALQIKMPVVVDELDDRVGNAYNAMPDRLFLVDKKGRVAYRGGQGPFGYNPADLEQALLMLLLDEGISTPDKKPVGPAPEPEKKDRKDR